MKAPVICIQDCDSTSIVYGGAIGGRLQQEQQNKVNCFFCLIGSRPTLGSSSLLSSLLLLLLLFILLNSSNALLSFTHSFDRQTTNN